MFSIVDLLQVFLGFQPLSFGIYLQAIVSAAFQKLLKESSLNWASQHWCLYSGQVLWSRLGLPELASVRWWSFLSEICWDAHICSSWVTWSISRRLLMPETFDDNKNGQMPYTRLTWAWGGGLHRYLVSYWREGICSGESIRGRD